MLTVTEYNAINGAPGSSVMKVIIIVVVDVSISGGVNPTTLIGVNNDDDNNNQVADNNINEFNVTNENNLLTISAAGYRLMLRVKM